MHTHTHTIYAVLHAIKLQRGFVPGESKLQTFFRVCGDYLGKTLNDLILVIYFTTRETIFFTNAPSFRRASRGLLHNVRYDGDMKLMIKIIIFKIKRICVPCGKSTVVTIELINNAIIEANLLDSINVIETNTRVL